MIDFENVSYSYAPDPGTEGPWALRDACFSVGAGECLGVAGCTGSGKSTLALLAAGLLAATRGCVRIDGRRVENRAGARRTTGRVGLLFQHPERQLFAATVMEDVAFGPRNLGIRGRELDDRCERALRSAGLDPSGVGGRNPFHLSGGTQRRVALAGVLAMEPAALVFDEPSAGLDPRSRASFLELFETVRREEGLCAILISHDMDMLARCCDRMALLDGGRMMALDDPVSLFARADLLNRTGLEPPRALNFVRKAEEAGLSLPLPYGVFDADGLADAIAAALPNACCSRQSPKS